MKKALYPIIIALVLIIGVLLGNILSLRSTRTAISSIVRHKQTKLDEVMNIVDKYYVDSISIDSIDEAVIPSIMDQLDPHCMYIPAKNLEAVNDELDGSFSGIGVQFSLVNDTIYVVDAINGGPSQRAGIQDGDRIVEVNDTAFVGKSINNNKVLHKLRGPKGSKVKLGIVRRHVPEILQFDVIRGDIPVNSVTATYMITKKIGLIAIDKFGKNTYNDFLTGVAKLKSEGCTRLIIDLRGNGGGYLDAAISMLNEFLKKGDLIVYVKGKAYPRQNTYANGTGSFQHMQIAILIDEFSGSASEVFTGAIQDNDRGLVIGRRSFGKGLVQQQVPLGDGSAIRITVGRYYTPSGRCIQKPYKHGDIEDYDEDIWNRYQHGEFFSKDSIHQNTKEIYKTIGGRTVYGGGGIMPDIFVPRDTIGITPYFSRLVNSGTIYKYALNYTDKNRNSLNRFKDWKSLATYLGTQNLFNQFVSFAKTKKINGSETEISTSQEIITHQLYAYIIRNIQGDNNFYSYLNQYDVTVKKAVDELQRDTNSILKQSSAKDDK